MITIDGKSYDIIEDGIAKISDEEKDAASSYITKKVSSEDDAKFLLIVLGLLVEQDQSNDF